MTMAIAHPIMAVVSASRTRRDDFAWAGGSDIFTAKPERELQQDDIDMHTLGLSSVNSVVCSCLHVGQSVTSTPPPNNSCTFAPDTSAETICLTICTNV